MDMDPKLIREAALEHMHDGLHQTESNLMGLASMALELEIMPEEVQCAPGLAIWWMALALMSAEDVDDERGLTQALMDYVEAVKPKLRAKEAAEAAEAAKADEWADVIDCPETNPN